MAKDITLKSPNGEEIYYPKTVSDLVYDNETGKTIKQIQKEDRVQRFYSLSNDSYITDNSIYINKLLVVGNCGKGGKNITVDEEFTLNNYNALVFDFVEETISIKKTQSEISETEDLLIIKSGASKGFTLLGKLAPIILKMQTSKSDVVSPYSNFNVLYLTGFGVDAATGGITELGNIYYNTNTKLLRKCVEYTNPYTGTYETVDADNETIYYNLSNDTCYINSVNGLKELIGYYENEFDKEVYYISYMGKTLSSSDSLKLGEYFYNTEARKLYKLISKNGFGKIINTKEVPINPKAIYIYNNQIYKWDSNDLVITGTNTYKITCNLPLQLGFLSEQTGNAVGAVTNQTNFFKGQISDKFIKVDSLDRIESIENLDSDETLYIYCYKEPTEFLGYITDYSDGFKSGTNYIKFYVVKSSAWTSNKILNVKFKYHSKDLEFTFNDYTRLTPRWISYEIEKPVIDNITATSNYTGIETKVYNNGFIMLPPNYNHNGNPIPLVIFVHGTEGYSFSQTSIKYYEEYLKFICYNGYAVADCSATSSLFPNAYDGNGGCAMGLSCYTGLYNYLMRNYNLKTDGVYIFGKSSGGIMTALLSNLQPFKVRAAGGLAPTTDLFCNMMVCLSRSTNFWIGQLGLTEEVSNSLGGSGDKQYVLENFEKFIGFNPMWQNTVNVDFKELAKQFLNTGLNSNSLESNTAIKNIIDNAYKIQNCPYKIWHAIDDVNVPIATSRFYKRMVDNAGGICCLRELPANCGQHHAVDNATNAPKVDYQTKFGGIINIPVSYAELVDWFERW